VLAVPLFRAKYVVVVSDVQLINSEGLTSLCVYYWTLSTRCCYSDSGVELGPRC